MSIVLAALPMYDWPELRAEVDAEWATLRRRLLAAGIDAPKRLTRRNADMPPVPGGILDGAGMVIAPDPATLPPDSLDLPTLWRHPALLFGQTCWGPMELGLADQVRVLAQPDYTSYEGGEGEFYSSAILMRRADLRHLPGSAAPSHRGPDLPLELLRGRRFAFNGGDSMSGLIALTRDLATLGSGPDIFAEQLETGAHRASIVAVAEGRADVCAVDCRSWDMARRVEPHAAALAPVGWTAKRRGLPYISSLALPAFALAPA